MEHSALGLLTQPKHHLTEEQSWSPRAESANTLISDFQASKIVRSKILLFHFYPLT